MTSNPALARSLQAIVAGAALELYNYYYDHPDWWLAAHADYWAQVYLTVSHLDVAWQDFTGALVGFNGYYALIVPSDGFIPGPRSQFPGAQAQYNLYLPQYPNIPHMAQMDHPVTRAQFDRVLNGDFLIARQAPPPPPNNGGSGCVPTGHSLRCPI